MKPPLRLRLLRPIIDVGMRRPRAVGGAWLAAALVSLIGVWHVTFETDVVRLLPDDDPHVAALGRALEAFGSTDRLILLVEAPEADRLDLLLDAGRALSRSLADLPEVTEARYRHKLGDLSDLSTFLVRRGLLLLPPEELDEVLDELDPEAIRRHLELQKRRLLATGSVELARWLQRDPLGWLPHIRRALSRRGGEQAVDLNLPREHLGAQVDPEGRSLLIFVRARQRAGDPAYGRLLMESVRSRWDELVARHPGWRDLQLSMTGGYVFSVAYEQLIRNDLKWTILGSLAAVAVLFGAAFRTRGLMWLVLPPLAAAIAVTLGAVGACKGRLSVIAAVFGAVIVGLGVDFAIHIYTHYRRRCADVPPREALEAALHETILGITGGAVTTAAAFGAVATAEFRAVSDLGLLAGVGIALTWLAMVTLFPALLLTRAGRLCPPASAMRSFGVIAAADKLRRGPWGLAMVVLGTGMALALLLCWGEPGIAFEESFRSLRPEHVEAFEVQQRIGRRFGVGEDELLVLAHLPRGSGGEALLDRLRERLEPALGTGMVQRLEGPVALLPPRRQQEESLGRLRQVPVERVLQALQETIVALGFRRESFGEGLENVRRGLQADQLGPIGLDELLTLMPGLADSFVRDEGSERLVLTLLHLSAERPPLEALVDLAASIESLDPAFEVTGMDVVLASFQRIARNDLWRTSAASLTAVLVVVFLWFRRISWTLLSLLPLGVGVVWMLAGMKLLGFELNPVNVLATPLLLGIGIDDGIHILAAYRQGGRSGADLLAGTGRAVVLTSLTTMAGFGSLVIAQYDGFVGLGAITLLGVGSCLVATLFLLVPLLDRLSPP